jgi:hypothetical protein
MLEIARDEMVDVEGQRRPSSQESASLGDVIGAIADFADPLLACVGSSMTSGTRLLAAGAHGRPDQPVLEQIGL